MKEFLSKEGVLLSIFPVLAFISALLFETGYADVFGFDHAFIEIDLKIMVVSIACVAIAFFPLFLYFYVFFRLASKGAKETRFLAIPMILPIPILIGLYMTGFESKIMGWLLVGSIIGGLFTFVRALVKSRKLGWKQAISEMATSQGLKDFTGPRPKGGEPTLKDEVIAYCVMLALLFGLGLMVRGIGSGLAHWKTNYQTFVLDGEEVAIIAVYGERVIAAGVTEDQFNSKISVIAKDSGKLVGLRSAYLKNFVSGTLYYR